MAQGGVKYSAAVFAPSNANVYFIPFSTAQVGVLNTETNVFSVILQSFPETDEQYSDGVLSEDGSKIYMIPFNAPNIGVVDVNTHAITNISIIATASKKYFGGVLATNGKIYLVPAFSLRHIGVLDPTAGDTFSEIDISSFLIPASDYYCTFSSAVLGENGMIYFIPMDGNTIGMLDPTTHVFSVLMDISTSFSGNRTMQRKYKQGIVVGGNKIYMVPGYTDDIGLLTLSLSGNTFEHLGAWVPSPDNQWNKYKGGVLLNDKIYMVPNTRSAIDVVDLNLGGCTACAVDTYSAEYGASTCQACPTHSSSPLHATTFDRCVCGAGYTGPDPGACTACVPGKYKREVGSAACTACPTTLCSTEAMACRGMVAPPRAQSNAVTGTLATAGLEMQIALAIHNTTDILDVGKQDAIAEFMAAQAQAGCGSSCTVLASSVVLCTMSTGTLLNASSGTHVFDMRVRIDLPDNARVLVMQQSRTMDRAQVETQLSSMPLSQFGLAASLQQYGIAYTRQPNRPFACGDSMVQGDEVCDDGNTEDGDGCSGTCTLETGHMCYGAVRTGAADERGEMTAWRSNSTTGEQYLAVLTGVDESCTKDGICEHETVPWDPDNWTSAYNAYETGGTDVPLSLLAPAGYYCKKFCTESFVPAKHYEFRDSCTPTAKDECSSGESTCDPNAYCIEPPDMLGYSCECDERYFVSALHGAACATSGVEVVFQLAGMRLTDAVSTNTTNLANMKVARRMFTDVLFDEGYLTAQSSTELLLEGVQHYPIDMVREEIEAGPLLGRSLWRIVLRAPDVHLNMGKMAAGAIFDDMAMWSRIFNDTDKYLMNQVGHCANDRARTCNGAGSGECLHGAVCRTEQPDVSVRLLDAGGATAPLHVGLSGLDVMSVEYDVHQLAFKVRMRYDNTVPGVIDTVFVSHMGEDQDPLLLPTFSSDAFPCLPLGTGLFQNQRDNSGAEFAEFCLLSVSVLHSAA